MFGRLRLYCVWTALLFLPRLHAQTLEEAWQVALQNHDGLKAMQASTRAAQQQLQAEQAQRLPSLHFGAGYTQFSDSLGAQTQINQQNFQFNTAQAGTARVQALASVPLFTSGRIGHNIQAAQASLCASEAGQESQAVTLKLNVAQNYFAVLRAQGQLDAAQQNLAAHAEHQRVVELRFTQGLVAKNETLSAALASIEAHQQLLHSQNALDIAWAHYNQLLNRPLNERISLQTYTPQLPVGSLETLTDTALKQRYELQNLAEQMSALENKASSVQAELLPQLALNGGYSYQENRYQVNQALWQAGVELQWQLDAQTPHKRAALNEQVATLTAQRADLAAQIRVQVRAAWLESEEMRQRIALNASGLAQALENYRLCTERYAQNLLSHSEVLTALSLVSKARADAQAAHYDYALAVLNLRRAAELL